MESHELFRIKDMDFTGHITVPSYTVNSQPSYEEWQDGNGVTHRDIVREKVSGSFSMWFNDIDEYTEFLDYVNDSTEVGGYVEVTLYVNNKNKIKECEVYITMDIANNIPYFNRDHEAFTVNVEER